MLGRKLMLRMMPDVTAQPESFYSKKPLKSEINFRNKDPCAEQMHNYTGNHREVMQFPGTEAFSVHLPHPKVRLRARRCLFTFPLRRQKWAHEFKTIELPEPEFAPLPLPLTHYDLWVVITSLPVTSSHHASRTKVTN